LDKRKAMSDGLGLIDDQLNVTPRNHMLVDEQPFG
jgi:hypothetical protein